MKSPYDVIIKPIITENSMGEMESNKYTFKVAKVNTLNVLGKVKRQGKFVGKRADWKKAIVALTPDSKPIEFFEGM